MSVRVKPGGRRGGRGCLWGCFGCLGLLAITVCVLAAAWALFAAMGPNPRKLYSGASDPVAEAALEEALANAGLYGAGITVLPIKGSSQQLAYIVLDEARGFSAADLAAGGDQGFLQVLQEIDTANRSQGLGIGQVAMEYRDESGEPLFVVAADQAGIQAFAAGEIDREELLRNTEVDLSNLLAGYEAFSEASGP